MFAQVSTRMISPTTTTRFAFAVILLTTVALAEKQFNYTDAIDSLAPKPNSKVRLLDAARALPIKIRRLLMEKISIENVVINPLIDRFKITVLFEYAEALKKMNSSSPSSSTNGTRSQGS
jgi:hypothetical protein